MLWNVLLVMWMLIKMCCKLWLSNRSIERLYFGNEDFKDFKEITLINISIFSLSTRIHSHAGYLYVVNPLGSCRSHRLHSNWQHSLCRGCRSFDGSPQRGWNLSYSCLSALSLVQAYYPSGGSRTQGIKCFKKFENLIETNEPAKKTKTSVL